jgi:hypothetical protein
VRKLFIFKSLNWTLLLFAALLQVLPACQQDKGASLNKNRESAPLVLEARIEPGEATIGDRITYTVSLNRIPETIAELPELSGPPDGLTPVDSGHAGPRSEGGRITEKKWTTFRVDRVGTLVFPPLKMRYQQNGEDKEAEAQAITLLVKSVLPQDMTDIHGLKPLELPKRNMLFLIAIASLLILSVAGAWFIWKKRMKPETVEPVLLPHEEVEQRLRELEAMGLLNRGDFRKYYFMLSEIFRKYLERRFEFPAVERTPEEILASLDALNVTEPHREEVRKFLRNTEPVKFAGAGSSESEAIAETDRVRRFVAETWQQTRETTAEKTHVAV